jgi:hypothetical protein
MTKTSLIYEKTSDVKQFDLGYYEIFGTSDFVRGFAFRNGAFFAARYLRANGTGRTHHHKCREPKDKECSA